MLRKGYKVRNTKYDDIQRDYLARAKFLKMPNPFVVCRSCGKEIWHDHMNIQRHMTECHIRDRILNQELGWKFVPSEGRNKRLI